jgi:hypothetical protein
MLFFGFSGEDVAMAKLFSNQRLNAVGRLLNEEEMEQVFGGYGMADEGADQFLGAYGFAADDDDDDDDEIVVTGDPGGEHEDENEDYGDDDDDSEDGGGDIVVIGEQPLPHCEMVDQQALTFVDQTMKSTYPPGTFGPIDTTGFSTGNPNWLHAEYIGFLGAGGQIGTTVVEVTGRGGYSPDFSQFVGAVEGFVHNHPAYFLNSSTGQFEERSDFLKAENRYPSTGDWNVLQAIADRYGPTTGNTNPSLYLVDPFGVAREFRLSDRAVFEALSQSQRQAGVGLAGREVDANANSGCGG